MIRRISSQSLDLVARRTSAGRLLRPLAGGYPERMASFPWMDIRPEVADALSAGRPVVALESTLIAHGLPWPVNLETALEAGAAVRAEGAVPATIAIRRGRAVIGLERADIEELARASGGVRKASRRDLPAALAQGADAATTVAATMYLAHRAGIRLFATGGIGGVHPLRIGDCGSRIEEFGNPQSAIPNPQSWDVSADLPELARTPVAVVCAGAKSILDLRATLEVLETLSVPVVGYATSEFPAFYLSTSGLPVAARVDSAAEAAALLRAHWQLDGGGVVLAQRLPDAVALDPDEFARALAEAERRAEQEHVTGPATTPYLLARLAEITDGRTLRANRALIVANASLAGRVARDLAVM
jgi:pseudouridine-5'-phosphate glycosidase